jgi:prephenate dehydrogenase
VIDAVETDAARAVTGADVVVLATPVGAMPAVLESIAGHVQPAAVVTDVGSVKGAVVEAARAALGAGIRRFVPGHPIAGTERSGVAASFAELFEGRRVVLSPCAETDGDAVERVRLMWEAAGARVSIMEAAVHDRVFAETSHLPHVLAYALVDCLARSDDGPAIFRYAAGGFYDFTRIASSDPVMWRDICVANAGNVGASLDRLRAALDEAAAAIARGDGEWLEEMFARAKQARDSLLPADARDASPE